jgi:hypothetical protein
MAAESGGCILVGQSKIDFLDFRQHNPNLHLSPLGAVTGYISGRSGECGVCAIDVLGIEGEIDHRDVFFSDHQKRENRKICPCVSWARGVLTIDTLHRTQAA